MMHDIRSVKMKRIGGKKRSVGRQKYQVFHFCFKWIVLKRIQIWANLLKCDAGRRWEARGHHRHQIWKHTCREESVKKSKEQSNEQKLHARPVRCGFAASALITSVLFNKGILSLLISILSLQRYQTTQIRHPSSYSVKLDQRHVNKDGRRSFASSHCRKDEAQRIQDAGARPIRSQSGWFRTI